MTRQPAWDDPERIGGYWIAARLGAGGQGVVYEAYDGAGARVALKVLHREASPAMQEQFQKEAQAARAVPPFCTARALAVSSDRGRPFLVSEYVPGPTLSARVGQEGPLDEGGLLRLAIGVATALAAIHSAGVTHRDLKPGNVLLGPDGPRIIDFGIARTSEMSLTTTGALLGTPGYMAPEVLDGQRATPASDVFAWAAVVVFAATGTEPFRGSHIGEVVYRTSKLDPDLSALPAQIRPLVAAALSKDPQQRPTSVGLLAGLVGTRPGPQASSTALLEDGAQQADRAGGPRWAPPTLVRPPLGQVAEAALRELPPSAQSAARELLLRMVEPRDVPDGSEDTVRTTTWEELYAGRSDHERDAIWRCVDAFARAGVLKTSDDGSCWPVSAALLPAWQRLREWIAADREHLRTHRALSQAAHAWHTHGERAEDLLHGSTLQTYLQWAAHAPTWIRPNPLERRFLEAARARTARTVRRRRQALSAGAVLVVMALTAGGVFWHRASESARQRDRETARSTVRAAEDLRTSAPDTSKLLTLAAWRIAELPETRGALLSAATRGADETITLPAASGGAEGTALSADGMTLARNTPSGLESWDLSRHQSGAEKPVLRDDAVLTAPGTTVPIVSPDGRTALVQDEPYRRVSTRKPTDKGTPVGGFGAFVPVQLTNAGDLLLRSGGTDRVVDATGKEVTSAAGIKALSPDGRYLAGCGGDDLTIRPLRSPAASAVSTDSTCAEVESAQFSPDGRTLVVFGGGEVDEVTLYDTRTGRALNDTWLQGFHRPAFSSKGSYVIGQSEDNGLEVRSREDGFGSPLFSTAEPGGEVEQLALDEATGTLSYLTPGSREVHQIDLAPVLDGGRKAQFPSAASASATQFSYDGGRALVRISPLGKDPVLRVVDTDTGQAVNDPFTQTGWGATEGAPSAALSGNGRRLAYDRISGAGWQPRIVDLTTGKETTPPVSLPSGHQPESMKLSPDGRYLSFTSHVAGAGIPDTDYTTQIYDLRARKKVHQYQGKRDDDAFTPDGRHHVTSRGELLDLTSGTVRKLPFKGTGYAKVAVAPDGTRLAAVDSSGRLDLWDLEKATRIARISPDRVKNDPDSAALNGAPVFSQDGTLLAEPLYSGGVRLWDISNEAYLNTLTPLVPHLDSMTFRHDSLRYLDHGWLHTTDLSSDALATTICKDVGRDITQAEWQKYIPSMEYRKVC
ncbi:protein kinase domain-containing protein [Streptomyces odontomachi]|uniref:protein kinase domain-containing protein n=1 Tax=Streptomyces odontomachi TaxID=2944940 RepID=UPI00210BA653|nr:serine/threonine-protein kinase [Streptomyces sp. ODS25]